MTFSIFYFGYAVWLCEKPLARNYDSNGYIVNDLGN